MFDYSSIRKDLYKRNDAIALEIYGINFLWRDFPYSRIKTIFNYEMATFFLYFLLRTNIKPNSVTFFGIFWNLLGFSLLVSGSQTAIYLALFIFSE